MTSRRAVVVDTDTGIDDALTLDCVSSAASGRRRSSRSSRAKPSSPTVRA